MQRALWKGAISFGLVHIPVELFSAEKPSELSLTMLDRRDFAPIGYKRINKETGKEVVWDDIVKGYEYEPDEYVVLSDEDLKRANVEKTQTIDIVTFVDAQEVALPYYERPYYLAPTKGGEKVYALLRETLRRANKIAVAQVVIRSKQHLAALFAMDDVIVLNTLRYAEEVRSPEELVLPEVHSKRAGPTDKEIDMALALVEGMSEPWDPTRFHDTYREDVLALVKKKVKAHQTKTITEAEPEPKARPSAQVIDLTALLKRSIAEKQSTAAKPRGASAKTSSASKPKAARAAKPAGGAEKKREAAGSRRARA